MDAYLRRNGFRQILEPLTVCVVITRESLAAKACPQMLVRKWGWGADVFPYLPGGKAESPPSTVYRIVHQLSTLSEVLDSRAAVGAQPRVQPLGELLVWQHARRRLCRCFILHGAENDHNAGKRSRRRKELLLQSALVLVLRMQLEPYFDGISIAGLL